MGSGASLRCSVRERASVSLLLLTAPLTRSNLEKQATTLTTLIKSPQRKIKEQFSSKKGVMVISYRLSRC
jgi:hypothetical protein